jgi:ketosteroid isomerase-like protein
MAAALACPFLANATTPGTADRAAITWAIEHDVAEIVAGINAHDVDRATRFDAPGIVSMEGGRPPSTGIASERKGLSMAFEYAPSWRLELIDETVDVAESGEMAVYRSTYNETSVDDGVTMTHKVNFIAGFARQDDGPWQVAWSVVAQQERSHPQ